MNNHRKYKKKKHLLTEFSQTNPVEDDEQLATQNLFNISNSWEDPQSINPHVEVEIFTSVNSEQLHYAQTDKIPIKSNQAIFGTKKNSINQSKELEKIMDKQFIRESKNLLKLYATPQSQTYLTQSDSIKSKKQTFLKKDEKSPKKGKIKLLCNSFKSDSVFVVKRRMAPQKNQIQMNKNRLQELKSTRKQNESLEKNSQMFINTQKCGYFSPYRNYFHGTKKKTPQNKSLSEVKHKFSQFDNFEDLKSLNRIKWMLLKNNMQNNQQSIRLTPDKQIRNFSLTTQIYQNPHNKTEERQKNNSFRKRYTFYTQQQAKKQTKLKV